MHLAGLPTPKPLHLVLPRSNTSERENCMFVIKIMEVRRVANWAGRHVWSGHKNVMPQRVPVSDSHEICKSNTNTHTLFRSFTLVLMSSLTLTLTIIGLSQTH